MPRGIFLLILMGLGILGYVIALTVVHLVTGWFWVVVGIVSILVAVSALMVALMTSR